MPADTLLFVVLLLLLRVRLRLVPDKSDEKGVDNDMVGTEVDIDEAADNDAEVGRCVRIELEEI